MVGRSDRKMRRSQDRELKLQSVPMTTKLMPLGDIRVPKPISPVGPEDREGVYVHSFKCGNCGLHFMLFSWRADRHNTLNTHCPECGQTGRYLLHYRAVVNESKQFQLTDKPIEIANLFPYPGSVSVDDPKVAPPLADE